MRAWGILFLTLTVACGDADEATPDGGALGADAGMRPMLPEPPAADAGPLPTFDAGTTDAGFVDPDTVLEGKYELEGLDTYIQMQGTLTSSMAPIIFLQSGPGLSHEYLPKWMKFMLPGRLLVFYDMRATGESSFSVLSGTSTVTAEQHALDLDALVDFVLERSPNDQVDLVGHGYGAAVAGLYAVNQPDRVRQMVMVTPYPIDLAQFTRRKLNQSARLTSSDREQITQITSQRECRGNLRKCHRQTWNIWGRHELCRENEELFYAMRFDTYSIRAERWVEQALRFEDYSWTQTMQQVQAPTLIISGACDAIPSETAAAYAQEIPQTQWEVLDDSGHFPFVESPERFQELLRSALSRP